MAVLFIDGFDKYGLPNANGLVSPLPTDLLTQGEWTVSSGFCTFVTGLSATGAALSFGNSTASVTKTFSTSYSRLIGGVRFSSGLGNAAGIQFYDSAASQQCGIHIQNNGLIALRNGNYASGTLVATSAASVTANSVHYLEWDLTFSNTGAYQIWLDGVSILSGTGDLTATANNNAGGIALGQAANAGSTWDDLYVFDTTGVRNNAVLLSSPRIETTFPSSNGTVQFSVGAATLSGSIVRGSVTNPPVNYWYVRPVTPTQNCTLNSLTIVGGSQSSSTIQVRPIVYSDSAGVPGTLLTTGATVTGMTAAAPKTMPLTTPQSLVAGTQYWIGLMSDISGAGNVYSQLDTTTLGRSATSTFASGAPGTAPASTAGQPTLDIFGNITGVTNVYVVGGGIQGLGTAGPPLMGQSYVQDSVVNDEDLYNMSALRFPPIGIYTTAVKAYVAKSDSGTRTVSVRTKSSSTDSAGSAAAQAPGSTFGWQSSYWDLDPNGNIAWTGAALNAAQAGFKIDS